MSGPGPDTRFDAFKLAARASSVSGTSWTISCRPHRAHRPPCSGFLRRERGLATAYAARANEFAGVSTPLRWEELDRPDLHPEEFTLETSAARFAEVGDLWRPMSAGPRLDLRAAMDRIGRLLG